jgi:hypothetical protein
MQNNYLNYLKNLPTDNNIKVSGQNTINDITKSINTSGLSGIEIGEKLIEDSSINEIMDYSDYQNLTKKFKTFIDTNYKNWYQIPIEKNNIYTSILEEATKLLSELFPYNKNVPNVNEANIFENLSNMFFYIYLIFIHKGEEVSLYSLINSYIKISEDQTFQRDKGIIYHNAWDTILIPISIKQYHLILIKLLDFWFGIGGTWESLKKRLSIKLL